MLILCLYSSITYSDKPKKECYNEIYFRQEVFKSMSQAFVMLANGFEEIEGLTVVDLLRRAQIDVTMVSIEETLMVTGSHQITVQADVLFDAIAGVNCDMLVLPGGMPGTANLRDHEGLKQMIMNRHNNKEWIAAICAAPSLVFGNLLLLKGKKAVCYPGMEANMQGHIHTDEIVAVDGHIVTSKALGTAIPFALTLIELLAGKQKSLEIKESIVY